MSTLFTEQAQPVPQKPGATIVKKFLLFTLVVTAVGLLVSVGCGLFVWLGWRRLRNDEGGEGAIDSILTTTGLSHAAFWITAVAAIVLYLLTVLVYWWVSTAEQRARTKKRAFKAKPAAKS